MSSKYSPEEVVDFWFSEEVKPRWFQSTADFDQQLRERFLQLYIDAKEGLYNAWQETPIGALALVIVFDQLPLNIFRNEPEGFACEARSREVSASAIEAGFDQGLPGVQRAFLYLPFMHSEELIDQDRSVELFTAADLHDNLKWARHHREIVRRFGRFPHRNEILGRTSTAEEIEYLNSKEAFTG